MQIPLPDSPSRFGIDLVWHYTNAQGLLGILQSDQLWATSTRMLNDGREIAHGLDLLGNEAMRYLEDNSDLSPIQRAYISDCVGESYTAMLASDIYAICASLESDSLSQWRAYAGSGGYAIGLDPNVVLTIVTEHTGRYFDVLENRTTGWRVVLYGDDDITDHARSVFDFLASTAPAPDAKRGSDQWNSLVRSGLFPLNLTAPWIKHPGFADEREVRWAFTGEQATQIAGATHLRTNNLGIVPYLRVTANVDPSGMSVSSSVSRALPIREIMVGPCPYPEAAIRGLGSALKITGYHDVDITLSEVPYR